MKLLFQMLMWGLPLLAWAEAPRSPEEWLNRVVNAAHQTRYSGIYVTQQDSRIESFRIFHAPVLTQPERTHILTLDGPHREIIRVADETRFYLPRMHTVRVETGSKRTYFPTLIERPFNTTLELYNLETEGEGRVAGMECEWLRFRPRDDFRYGHRICVDKASGLILRADSLGPDGTTQQTSFFTQLQVGPQAMEEQSFHPHSRDDWETQAIASGDVAASDWRIAVLPPGFHKVTEVKMPGGRSGQPIIHQVYSDGLASVSVFIEGNGNLAHQERPHSPFKSMNIYHLDVNEHRVFLVGEVPTDTLARMGQSLVFSTRSSQHP
jgi:sigma-E factor negative regulatory protein RseB